MGNEEMSVLLYKKIDNELKAFKRETLDKEKEEIYGMAYEIDSMITLYEMLVEHQELSDEMLGTLLIVPNLLSFLYNEWLLYQDHREQDFYDFITEELSKMLQDSREEQEVVSA